MASPGEREGLKINTTSLGQLTVISKDGFPIQVSVKVVIRVRPDQAPYMVVKVGSIDNLIQQVIHPMIDSSFRNQASTASAMNFLSAEPFEGHRRRRGLHDRGRVLITGGGRRRDGYRLADQASPGVALPALRKLVAKRKFMIY